MLVLGNLDVIHSAKVVASDNLKDVPVLVWGKDSLCLDGGLAGLDELLGGGDCNDHDAPVG